MTTGCLSSASLALSGWNRRRWVRGGRGNCPARPLSALAPNWNCSRALLNRRTRGLEGGFGLVIPPLPLPLSAHADADADATLRRATGPRGKVLMEITVR